MTIVKAVTVALTALCCCACVSHVPPKSIIHSIDINICADTLCSICANTSELPK